MSYFTNINTLDKVGFEVKITKVISELKLLELLEQDFS